MSSFFFENSDQNIFYGYDYVNNIFNIDLYIVEKTP